MRTWMLALCCLAPLAADAHELGLNIGQSATVGSNVTKDANLKWVRIDLSWDLAQPADAAPDFTALDSAVNVAIGKNLSVVMVIGNTPAWASVASVDATHRNDVPIAGKYDAFVALAVARFKDRVTRFELWNEPNLTTSFEGSLQQFIDLIVKPGADAVHAQCPACLVLSPGLSTKTDSQYDLWLDAILKQAAAKVDILSGHIFASFTEDDPKAGVSTDSFLNLLETHRFVRTNGITTYEGPLSFKEVMDKNMSKKPFWLTATGFPATAGDSVALAAQTRYLRHVLEKAALRPWWTVTTLSEASDLLGGSTSLGITTDTGSGTYAEKPAFAFLKQAVTGLAFGGINPVCSDFLDNDEDGNIDFPDDSDCFDPNSTTEGALIDFDLATTGTSLDGGFQQADGDSMGGVPPVHGGGVMSPAVDRGCAFVSGDGDSSRLLILLFAVSILSALFMSRRRA